MDPILDRFEVTTREVEHMRARGSAGATQIQNFTDLFQRKSERLCLLDEPKLLDRAFRVPPVAGSRTGRRWKKADAFVLPDRRDGQSTPFRHVTDEQSCHSRQYKP
jgi:hypothetical protein